MTELLIRIKKQQAKIVVVGLGHVGLPLAIAFANKGCRVWGVDRDETRVGAVSAGDWPLVDEPLIGEVLRRVVGNGTFSATTNYAACADADVVIICVPTPAAADSRQPDLSMLDDALVEVSEYLRPHALVVIGSTLPPGFTRSVERYFHADILIAHCPERVNPGRSWESLHRTPRIIGGTTARASECAEALYANICEADSFVTTAENAEVVKTAENALRDVQIAFANELALVCQDCGADFWEVRKLINSRPDREILKPGIVGGACIPKDTYLLAEGARCQPDLMLTARYVNAEFAGHVVHLILMALRRGKVSASGARVVLLGMAYKPDFGEVRGSRAPAVAEGLTQAGAKVSFWDPIVEGEEIGAADALEGANAAIILVPHGAFAALNWELLGSVMRHKVLVDACGIVSARPPGFTFAQIGRGIVE